MNVAFRIINAQYHYNTVTAYKLQNKLQRCMHSIIYMVQAMHLERRAVELALAWLRFSLPIKVQEAHCLGLVGVG